MNIKTIIFIFLIIILIYSINADLFKTYDFAQVHSAKNMQIYQPRTVIELKKILKTNNRNITIKGAGYSHGGQTLCDNAIQIDMKNINHMKYNPQNKQIIIGAGAIWYDVLVYLAKFKRTVAEMQSYYNFSVGGSISVNCHNRNINYSSISDTIISLKVLLTDGSIITCSRKENTDLFLGVIGGYSLLGIIIEATLITIKNIKLELETKKYSIKNINRAIDDHHKTFLFNLNIYPGNYDEVVGFYWKETDKKLTETRLVQPIDQLNLFSRIYCRLSKMFDSFKLIRAFLEPKSFSKSLKTTVTRLSYQPEDLSSLQEYTKKFHTTVLQEFFVPIEKSKGFINYILPRIRKLNILNISLRIVKPIRYSLINYSPVKSLGIVIYFSIWNTDKGFNDLKIWTNKILEKLVELEGKFYLPYLLSYDPQYVWKMYPSFKKLLDLKKKYDPKNRINHKMLEHISQINSC